MTFSSKFRVGKPIFMLVFGYSASQPGCFLCTKGGLFEQTPFDMAKQNVQLPVWLGFLLPPTCAQPPQKTGRPNVSVLLASLQKPRCSHSRESCHQTSSFSLTSLCNLSNSLCSLGKAWVHGNKQKNLQKIFFEPSEKDGIRILYSRQILATLKLKWLGVWNTADCGLINSNYSGNN